MKVTISIDPSGETTTRYHGGLNDNEHTARVFAAKDEFVRALIDCQNAPHEVDYTLRRGA